MQPTLYALADELIKIAATTLKEKVDSHFSAQTKDWDEFKNHLNSPRFRNLVTKHPQADEKLKLFVQNLGKHFSSKGTPNEVIGSTGKKHIVKSYKDGSYTCDCEHYMYRGAPTNSGCKHIDQVKSSIKTATIKTELKPHQQRVFELKKTAQAIVKPYQQESQYSCSAACLKAVLNYYGFKISEVEAVLEIGVKKKKGAETTQIVDAAKSLGFESYEKSLSMEEARSLINDGIPIICDIQSFTKKNSGHYVVLCDLDDTYAYLMDPNTLGNTRKLTIKEFEDRWHDRAMAPPHESMIRWGVIVKKKTTQDK